MSDRLAPLDSLFLYLEKKEMPLHIGSVFVFDGPLPVDDLTSLVEAKLPLLPRYRQRIVFPPLNLGHPTWEDDPEFDIHRHIRHARLKRGTRGELQTLAGQIFSEIMDRNRPLWDLTVVDGLREGRSALIARVHHCMVDGVAGVGLLNVVLDQSPQPPKLPPKRAFHPKPLPAPATSLLDAAVSLYSSAIERALAMQSAALNVAAAVSGELLRGALSPGAGEVAELFRPVERFPFNAPSLGPRKLSWAEFSMDPVNAIREARGVKLNDVVLAVLTGAVRRYARLHGRPVKNRLLRLMVPVNLRSPAQNGGLGNQISLIPVNIPMDVTDPLELLNSILQRTEALKHAHAADLVVLGGALLATMPVPMQALLGGLLANVMSVLPFNMVCTNVPGPPAPLYLLGRRMLTYHPYVPIGDFMGICCAITSYDGKLYFGLTGDSVCAPDLDRLRDFLKEAFEELCGAAVTRELLSERVAEPPLGSRAG